MTSAARDDIPILASPAHLDEEAFGRLLDAHTRDAFNLAFRILRRREDAADAVQDAFVRALRAWRGERAAPREPGRFRSWLLRIVSNVALDQLRSRARASVSSLGGLEDRLVAPDARPDRAFERREERGAVLHALLSLPASQRAALTLREYQDLTYDEIGQQLGTDRAATAMLLFRARVAFREAYQGLSKHDGAIGCPELGPLLSALVDGELDADSWTRIDVHLKVCGRCRRELRGLRHSKRLYAAIPLLAPPAGWSWAALAGAGTAEAALLTASSGPGIATTAAGLAGSAAATTAAASVVTAAVAPASLASAPGLGGMLAAIGSLAAGKNALVATALAVTVALGSPGAAPVPPARGQEAQVSAPAVAPTPSADPVQRSSGLAPTPDVPAIPVAAPPNAADAPPPVVHGSQAGTASGGAAQKPELPPQAASPAQAAPSSRAFKPLVAADAADRVAASAARGRPADAPSPGNAPSDARPEQPKEPPGQDQERPGHASEPPGEANEPPSQAKRVTEPAQQPPAQSDAPPGQAQEEHGPANEPPGQAEQDPEQSHQPTGLDQAPGLQVDGPDGSPGQADPPVHQRADPEPGGPPATPPGHQPASEPEPPSDPPAQHPSPPGGAGGAAPGGPPSEPPGRPDPMPAPPPRQPQQQPPPAAPKPAAPQPKPSTPAQPPRQAAPKPQPGAGQPAAKPAPPPPAPAKPSSASPPQPRQPDPPSKPAAGSSAAKPSPKR